MLAITVTVPSRRFCNIISSVIRGRIHVVRITSLTYITFTYNSHLPELSYEMSQHVLHWNHLWLSDALACPVVWTNITKRSKPYLQYYANSVSWPTLYRDVSGNETSTDSLRELGHRCWWQLQVTASSVPTGDIVGWHCHIIVLHHRTPKRNRTTRLKWNSYGKNYQPQP